MRIQFSSTTLKIQPPYGRTLLLAVGFIPVFILALELLLRVIPVPAGLFVPSVDRELNYPEIDIKLSRLSGLNREADVNCLLLGSSMADFAFIPEEFNQPAEIAGVNEPVCFNMALKAMKPEITARLAPILLEQEKPALLIMGISPVDFTGGQSTIRKFVNAPWVRYRGGEASLEGWWIDHSAEYRYWLSFLKYRDPAYRSDLKGQLTAIDGVGGQHNAQKSTVFRVKPIVAYPEYSASVADIEGFRGILALNSPAVRVVVVEMPVHPDFLSYYLQGGQAGYDYRFLRPIQAMTVSKDITFIRTQPDIKDVVSPDGWTDEIHLNRVGASQFSRWLAEKLIHE